MGNKIAKNQNIVTTVEIVGKSRKCQSCKRHNATYMRSVNLSKIPQKYILTENDVCYNMLISKNKFDINPLDLINLPKNLVMTKYDYYVCDICYEAESPMSQEWNVWRKI